MQDGNQPFPHLHQPGDAGPVTNLSRAAGDDPERWPGREPLAPSTNAAAAEVYGQR